MCGSLAAQTPDAVPAVTSPQVAFVTGDVEVERARRAVTAERGTLLSPGDRIRGRAGRAEIAFPGGSTLHVNQGTTVLLLGSAGVQIFGTPALLLLPNGEWLWLSGRATIERPAGGLRPPPHGLVATPPPPRTHPTPRQHPEPRTHTPPVRTHPGGRR